MIYIVPVILERNHPKGYICKEIIIFKIVIRKCKSTLHYHETSLRGSFSLGPKLCNKTIHQNIEILQDLEHPAAF